MQDVVGRNGRKEEAGTKMAAIKGSANLPLLSWRFRRKNGQQKESDRARLRRTAGMAIPYIRCADDPVSKSKTFTLIVRLVNL